MTDIITYESALEALKAVVAEKGEDYVYAWVDRNCLYTHNGKPSCGVGHVLHRLGVDIERFEGTTMNAQTFDRVAYNLNDFSVTKITQSAIDLLREFQLQQDDGRTWGEALGIAILSAEQQMENRANQPLRPVV